MKLPCISGSSSNFRRSPDCFFVRFGANGTFYQEVPQDMCNGFTKEEIHEQYKKKLACVLLDFYVKASNKEPAIEKLSDLTEFISKFIENHIAPPKEDWNLDEMP